jgi:hypothetical protein
MALLRWNIYLNWFLAMHKGKTSEYGITVNGRKREVYPKLRSVVKVSEIGIYNCNLS